MGLPVRIVDPATGREASVTRTGALAVGAIQYDEVSFQELATDNIAFNFYTPKAGQQFVITLIHLKADRDVSNTVDAAVVIYEATSVTETTVAKVLFQVNMVRNNILVLPGLNILVSEGVWINGKTTDDDIFVNITGYYIPAV